MPVIIGMVLIASHELICLGQRAMVRSDISRHHAVMLNAFTTQTNFQEVIAVRYHSFSVMDHLSDTVHALRVLKK